MKRNSIFIYLFFLSAFCFSQQNMPGKIYGSIPNVNSTKLYEIQVGAFKDIENAEKYILILEKNGYVPVYEQYLDFTRVKITRIPAKEIRNYLQKMKQMGFDEVIIREDTTQYIIEEEIIIIEEYTEEEIIEETIEEDIMEEAVIEEMPEPPIIDIDVFCRTWKIINSDKAEYNGYYMLFSDDGTLLITKSDGESYVAKWRWYDELNEFEYSHDNWQSYGRVKITKLDKGSLVFSDPGYNILGNGYSTLGKGTSYELEPLYNPDAE